MGNVSGSTFYMFLGVLVIYLIGVSIYTLVQKIKKKRKKEKMEKNLTAGLLQSSLHYLLS